MDPKCCLGLGLCQYLKGRNVSHFGRFRAFIQRAMFLVNVAHLRLVTLQIRGMFHTFVWSVSRRDECFTLSSLSGLCPKGNVFSCSSVKFDEQFTLSRGRYPTVTNVSHVRPYLFCQCIVKNYPDLAQEIGTATHHFGPTDHR